MINKLVPMGPANRERDNTFPRLLPVADPEGKIDQAVGRRLHHDLQTKSRAIETHLQPVDSVDLQLQAFRRLIETVQIEHDGRIRCHELHRNRTKKQIPCLRREGPRDRARNANR